jgi:hypothetical protein
MMMIIIPKIIETNEECEHFLAVAETYIPLVEEAILSGADTLAQTVIKHGSSTIGFDQK